MMMESLIDIVGRTFARVTFIRGDKRRDFDHVRIDGVTLGPQDTATISMDNFDPEFKTRLVIEDCAVRDAIFDFNGNLTVTLWEHV